MKKNIIIFLIYGYDCVSIVGDNIKKYKKINQIMDTIQHFDIKLTSYSSNDMTLSFIIDKQVSIDLSNKIHNIIFPYYKFNYKKYLWEELLTIKGPEECKYLYNLDIVKEKINNLKSLSSIDRIYYSSKSKILGLFNKATARAILCLCPPEIFFPLSPTFVWMPSSNFSINSLQFAISIILSMKAFDKLLSIILKLSTMVPNQA